ncbi:MAG TPA: hypothetical protein VHC22_05425 [Pirellulales bacterium]|nr:hypothetical protein [Pirellulales bacterium]
MSNKSKQGGHKAEQASEERWRPHQDWRVFVAVVLMLVAMVVYLMTMDESLLPTSPTEQPVPAEPTR